jgi:hypothetical protein
MSIKTDKHRETHERKVHKHQVCQCFPVRPVGQGRKVSPTVPPAHNLCPPPADTWRRPPEERCLLVDVHRPRGGAGVRHQSVPTAHGRGSRSIRVIDARVDGGRTLEGQVRRRLLVCGTFRWVQKVKLRPVRREHIHRLRGGPELSERNWRAHTHCGGVRRIAADMDVSRRSGGVVSSGTRVSCRCRCWRRKQRRRVVPRPRVGGHDDRC